MASDKRTKLWAQLRKLSEERQHAMTAARGYVDRISGDLPVLKDHFERLFDLDRAFNRVAYELQELEKPDDTE